MRSVTAVIAGAGVIGASIACHLASRGVRVIVIDRESQPGGGSTSKATGGFRSQFGTAVNVRLSLLSREKLLRFPEEIGCDSGYRPHGYLFLARSEAEMLELRAANGVQRECGVNEARLIGADEARAINPAIADDGLTGAAFSPTDGFIRPLQILGGYLDAARRQGAEFRMGLHIERLRVERGRFVAVMTSSGPVEGDVFVNAAGAWAASLSDVPVTPLRRRVACTVPTAVLPESMPMTIWTGDGFHLRVRDGRVMLLWPDNPPDDATWMHELLARAHERVPVTRTLTIDPDHCWSGLYEMSPDRHAIIGRDPSIENAFLANGSSGHGVMHAPAIGQVVAEMICGERTSVDVHALRPSRFAEEDPVRGPELL